MTGQLIQRTKTVTNLTIVFLICSLCVNGAFSLISFIYDSIGLFNLGQSIMFCSWIAYSIGILYTKQILNMFAELRTCMFVGWIINGLPILVAIFAYGCYQSESSEGICNKYTIKGINLAISSLGGGLASTFLWTGQYEFINRISTEQEKPVHYSIFYSLMQFAGIIANILNILFYTFEISSIYCFTIFYLVYIGATLSITWVLPEINGYSPNANTEKENIVSLNILMVPLAKEEAERKPSQVEKMSYLSVGQESPDKISNGQLSPGQISPNCGSFQRQGHLPSGRAPSSLLEKLSHHSLRDSSYQRFGSLPKDHKLSLLEKLSQYSHNRSSYQRLGYLPGELDPPPIILSKDSAPGFFKAVKIYYDLLMQPTMFKVFPFMIQSGLVQMFGPVAVYRYVVQVYAGTNTSESQVKRMISLQAIILALGGLANSQLLNTVGVSGWRNRVIMIQSWTITLMMIFVWFTVDSMNSLWLALFPAFIFGASDVGINQLMSIYTSEEFPGQTEAFALFKQMQNLFCAFLVFLFIVLPVKEFYLLNAILFVGLSIWLRLSLGTSPMEKKIEEVNEFESKNPLVKNAYENN